MTDTGGKRVWIVLCGLAAVTMAGCAEMDCDYVPMSADRPLVANLTYYLKSRSAALK